MESHDTTSEYAADADPMTTRLVRASSSPSRPSSVVAQPESAPITAELPVQRAPSGAVVRRPAGPIMTRRQPAPVMLQILVWFLALVFLIVVAAALVAAISPNSVTFLRHTTSAGLTPLAGAVHLPLG